MLDVILGEDHGMPVFSNDELQHLIQKHAKDEIDKLKEFKTGPELGLSNLQVNLITGAIKMTNLEIVECQGAMVSRNLIFMISTDDIVDIQLFKGIAQSKQFNIPVYYGTNRNIILGTISSTKFLSLKLM